MTQIKLPPIPGAIQKDKTDTKTIAYFRVVTWFVGVCGLMSPGIIVPYLTREQRADNLAWFIISWGICFLLYLFLRFFKNQTYVENK